MMVLPADITRWGKCIEFQGRIELIALKPSVFICPLVVDIKNTTTSIELKTHNVLIIKVILLKIKIRLDSMRKVM